MGIDDRRGAIFKCFLENRKLKDGLIFKLTNEAKFKIPLYLDKQNIEKEIFLAKQDKFEVDIFNKKINRLKYLQDQETLIKSIKERLNLNENYDKKILLKYFDTNKLLSCWLCCCF